MDLLSRDGLWWNGRNDASIKIGRNSNDNKINILPVIKSDYRYPRKIIGRGL